MAKLLPGTQLQSRYVIEGLVGQGAMSSVYRAREVDSPAIAWAIKEMTADALPDHDQASAEALFRHEASLLARLSHPSLPQVVDYFAEGPRCYLVMECIAGMTLEAVVERMGPYNEQEILPIAVQLAACLKYLHRAEGGPIIFRDLKPSNVMIEFEPGTAPGARPNWRLNGHVKLVDFGIARFFKPGKDRDTQPLGTPGFAAPEQYGAGQTTERTDLYGLGATLHYAMSAKDPDPAGGRFVPLRTLNPQISEGLEKLVSQLLETEPSRRPESAVAVLDRLLEIQQGLTAPATGPSVSTAIPTRLDLAYMKDWFRRTFSLKSLPVGLPWEAWLPFALLLLLALLIFM